MSYLTNKPTNYERLKDLLTDIVIYGGKYCKTFILESNSLIHTKKYNTFLDQMEFMNPLAMNTRERKAGTIQTG